MFSDYRAFGITPSAVIATGTVAVDDGSQGFIHLLAIAQVTLTNVVLRYPKQGVTSDTTVTVPAGGQFAGFISATVSGQGQFFFFKS